MSKYTFQTDMRRLMAGPANLQVNPHHDVILNVGTEAGPSEKLLHSKRHPGGTQVDINLKDGQVLYGAIHASGEIFELVDVGGLE